MNVICYGDSNTYGYDPRSYFGDRYENPWPELLCDMTGWHVCNQGENGREIPSAVVAFSQHTDLLVVMLGTNDLLQSRSPKEIEDRMLNFLSRLAISKEKILLISPPPMVLGEWVQDKALLRGSDSLEAIYRAISQRLGIRFVCTRTWDIPIAYDGVHMTQEGHRVFAERLFDYLKGSELQNNE